MSIWNNWYTFLLAYYYLFYIFSFFQFDEGGLFLPARNYYLNESDKDVVNAYEDYITRVMKAMTLTVFLYRCLP